MRGERVPKRARREKRDRTQSEQRQRKTDVTHHPQHDHHLQYRDDTLLDAVDQHPLHRSHIFE